MFIVHRIGYSKVGSCPYPMGIGHKLIREEVELINYVKPIIINAKGYKSDDKIIFSSANSTSQSNTQNNENNSKIQENTDDADTKCHTENNGNGMKNKQNMSLPPHWRVTQPTVENNHENNNNFGNNIENYPGSDEVKNNTTDQNTDSNDDKRDQNNTIITDKNTSCAISHGISEEHSQKNDPKDQAESIKNSVIGTGTTGPRSQPRPILSMSDVLEEQYSHPEVD